MDRVFGAVLAEGATPEQASQRFVDDYAQALGVPAAEVEPLDPESGQLAAGRASKPVGLMYDRQSGQYKYWLYRYGHARGGVRVYRSELLTLVRNGGNHPVVWASSTLKGLGAFVPPAPTAPGSAPPQPDAAKSLQAVQGSTDFTGRLLTPPASLSRIGSPELTIFAGSNATSSRPTLALDYEVESVSPPGKWRLIASAATGDVLHVEERIHFEDVPGSVAGNVTQGVKAMECADEVPTAFAYAEVGVSGGGSTFADATGAFVLPNSGTDAVSLQSAIGGNFFDVVNVAGPEELLTQSVVPPGPANFVHNLDNTAEFVRAQANGYFESNQVRDFLLSYVPDYPVIATQLNFPVNVNRTDVFCPGNAWYDGSSINFCVGSASYGNTSFGSVNHHEYGHHIVNTGGSGQGAYGEGMSDVVAMLLSGDPGLGYGFFLNQCSTPLRTADNDCQYSATACSSCGSEVHACGNLISGTIWDIRQALAASEPETYVDTINSLVLSSIPMHSGTAIDSSIAVDLLTLDDDDANLDNGTPHYAQICSGFAAHGMSCPPILTGLTVTPAAILDSEGPTGGPFAPESISYTLKNLGPEPVIQYAVAPAGSVPWVEVLNGSGDLELNEEVQVTIAIDQAEAAALANGGYDAIVEFDNLTTGVGDTTRAVELQVGVPLPIFTEDFEDGLGDFSVDLPGAANLWHVSASCASMQPGHSQPSSLYFGLDATCDFQNGTTVKGTVTSPAIVVQDTSLVQLRFKYFLETESSTAYDKAIVSASVNDGPYTVVASNGHGGQALVDSTAATSWQSAELDISALFGGQPSGTLRVRFSFDSVDGAVNAHDGFLVDDVEVRAFAGTCTSDAECDDGAFCNGAEVCVEGSCTGGTPVVCDDGVACTADACDENTDSCSSAPNDAACSDGSPCNGSESCDPEAGCQAGLPLDCDDGSECTADACDSVLGCTHTPVVCDDGSACTVDSCNPASGCQFTALDCADGNECTVDSCNPATGCVYENGSGACTDDGNSCTSDVCSAGACTHPDNGSCSNGPFVESGGQVVMEAEHFHSNTPRANHTWDVVANTSASGGQLLQSNPNNGANINTGYTTGSPELGYQVQFTTTGTYYVWLRGIGPNGDADSCHAGLDGVGPASADRLSSFSSSLSWSRSTMDGPVATINVTTPGLHTVNVWMREDGFSLDKIVLTTNNGFTPSGNGPAESPKQGSGCTSSSQCNDGNSCTEDACVGGACQNTAVANGTACSDDGNVCTNDVCSAGACTHPNNTAPCADDGSSCTNDVCSGGVCTHPSNGSCGSSPCSAYCSNPVTFTSNNYQSGNLGSQATCHQTTANLSGGVCGNFANGRQLFVNGQQMSCTGNWPSLPPKVNGGYCVYTTSGEYPWAYFATW